MIKKTSSILLVSAILTACGGGGGGSDPAPAPVPAPEPDLIEVSSQTLSVPENTSGIITITSSAEDLAFDITDQHPSGAASVTLGEGSLTVEASEVDRPSRISGTLYSRAKGINDSTSKDISIVISNTSAQAVLTQSEQLVDQSSEVLSLAEDKAVMQFVLESAYLSSLISNSEKTTLIDGFDAQSAPTYATTASEIEYLEVTLQDYMQGNLSDSELSAAVSNATTVVASHSDYAAQELADISVYSDVFLGDLTQTQMAYDETSGRYSRYLGQASMGAYSDGAWSFNGSYTLLSSLITTLPSDPILLCEAN